MRAKSSIRQKLVLAFHASTHEFGTRQFNGVQRFALDAGWRVVNVEYGTKVTRSFPDFEVRSSRDIRRILESFKPDGCLVESENDRYAVCSDVFADVPTVFLDRLPDTLSPSCSCVFSDAADIAACAVRELVLQGAEHYAYLPHLANEVWSRQRGEAFRKNVAGLAHTFSEFKLRSVVQNVSQLTNAVADWLQSLPKPCCLFAANDPCAELALRAAHERGIAVPDDLAVIGVDDSEAVCENTQPTLSSVRQDYERGGYLAAELLSRLMDNRRLKGLRATFGVSRVVRRASTRRSRGMDARVATALEFIRLHACEGAEPPDVVSAMGCSRRLADLRFREALGHTILDEIHAVRLMRVKELLLDPSRDLASIPDFCGYSSMDDLRRVFRRHFGMTLRAFVKQENGLL